MEGLEHTLMVHPDTKVVRFMRTHEEIEDAMAEWHEAHGLPGVIGVIDGTLILMRKPTRAMTGGDADSFCCYKGHVPCLVLAVCDVRGRFIYVSAGAPGTVGDAGRVTSY
jgi:hypothetical protein